MILFKKLPVLTVLVLMVLTSCKKDNTPDSKLPQATIDKVEIGLNNNEIAVVGRDFHFNAEVLAGDKIENVQIKIVQRSDETYSKPWSHEIIWNDYNGVKNATVHKHFSIPNGAAEGKYDFLIIVSDLNGTRLEEKRTIRIYAPENLPVDPKLDEFSVSARTTTGNRVLYILTRGGYRDPVSLQYGNYQVQISKSETLSAAATISGIKDNGKIYVLLINKKHNHRPESIDVIDFSKAIVVDAFEHKNMVQTDRWSHVIFDRPGFPEISRLLVGAANDNNSPNPSPINGLKTWESGNYYLGFIYHNTTHNMGMFHYIDLTVNLN